MAEPSFPPYYVGDLGTGTRRSAPAAQRNVLAIGDALEHWLPTGGIVLEIASGTGEHALAFARRFSHLDWQPTDPDPPALASIAAWHQEGPGNLREPLFLDVREAAWPTERADAILCINMVHISPWASALGLLDGARRLLAPGGPLILYGPWLTDAVVTAPSNLEFDADLRRRDPSWGLRSVEQFATAAAERGLDLVETRSMPANNLMLLLLRRPSGGR